MTEETETRTRSVYVPSGSVGHYFSPEEDMSVADTVAALPRESQDEILDGLSMDKLQYDADFWCRPSQLALINSSHWLNVALAGRGWGKSFTLAKAMHKYAMENPGCFLALVGRTTADVRDVLILGDSGLMNVIDPKERPTYKANVRRIVWDNGSEAMTFSAERPDGIRGPQFHAAFCDEVGSYRVNPGSGLANAFDQIKIATRLGDNPQIFVATTPRRVPAILDIVKQAENEPDKVLLVRGSTMANRHLSETYKDVVTSLYDGTALGKQEIEGELLADVEGALLPQGVIDDSREEHHEQNFWAKLPYRVVGVDPSVSSRPNDECGIVVVGSTGERKLYKREGYVLEDASVLGSPDVWAQRVVEMARKYRAVVVAEDNQGGEMVRMVIQAIDSQVPVTLVRSSAGKMARAEPVGLAYERGRVHHTDWFTELEAQLTSWAPDQGMASPDRLDALVHAATALLVNPPKQWVGSVRSHVPGDGRALDVKDHDPLSHPVAPSPRTGVDRTDRARLGDVDGVRPEDVFPHEHSPNPRERRFGRLHIGISRETSGVKAYGPPGLRFRRRR